MTNKSKLIYKIITIVTLALPTTLYLFLSATLFNINADITIKHIKSADLVIVEDFGYTTNQDAIFSGETIYQNGQYGFYISDDTIIKVDDGYYSYIDNELVDIKRATLQKETSYRLPLAFIVSVIGIGIIALVVQKKMQVYKNYPRISVLVSLILGTLVLYLIDIIAGSLFIVFLIATISWAVYCVEYMVKENMITEEDAKKSESDLLGALRKALGE